MRDYYIRVFLTKTGKFRYYNSFCEIWRDLSENDLIGSYISIIYKGEII